MRVISEYDEILFYDKEGSKCMRESALNKMSHN